MFDAAYFILPSSDSKRQLSTAAVRVSKGPGELRSQVRFAPALADARQLWEGQEGCPAAGTLSDRTPRGQQDWGGCAEELKQKLLKNCFLKTQAC